MNLDGSAVLPGSPERVWAAITDPAVLARTIPGCLSLQEAGEDVYTLSVSAGVGAIRGTYAGQVRLTDLKPHMSYVLQASGAGAPGSVRATVQVNLHPDGDATQVTYSADAVVGGAVAGVGQRMITGVARRMAGQFFTAVDAELTRAADVPAGSTPVTVPGPGAGTAPEPAPPGDLDPVGTGASAAPVAPPGPAAAAAPGGWVPTDARPLLVGAAGGGVLTLIGVWVGYLLGRRR